MKVSRRAEHAVKAVLDLALRDPAEGVSRADEIAARTGVPEKFLTAILRELGEAGVVESRRGPRGGHRLAHVALRMTVGDVVRVIDGPLTRQAPQRGGGASPAGAALQGVWARVDEAVRSVIDSVTFDELRLKAGYRTPPDFSI
jgi:Rrf2 family iron-sulfur cluster assembly transcriptional regulator